MDSSYKDVAPSAFQPRRGSAVLVTLCASLATLALAAFPVLAAAASAPSAVVDPAVQTAGGFSLRGTIEPHELDTHYRFEYGTTTSYGTNVPMPPRGD
jgi:hypothetical protein